MKMKLSPFCASGQIVAPPSKSVAHRLLISAALKRGKTLIKNVGDSADVKATCSALSSLGAKIDLKGGNATVVGIENPIKNGVLDCNESGSTLRFLMPVACALGANATFTGSEKLLSRPSGVLLDQLSRHGITQSGWTLNGKLRGGRFEIDATVSSQYITGLLLALPVLEQDSEIVMQGNAVSKDYINITLSALEKSGVVYEKSGNSIIIKGNQEYKLPNEVTVEGDWSGAAFPLTLGAISGEVTLLGVDINSKQGDKEIINVLKKAGAKVEISGNKITVKKGELIGYCQDFENIPDLAPICAVLSACCKGESTFSGIERLKIKESDRVKTTLEILKSGGITAYERDGKIIIEGGDVKGGVYDGANDHRIVMSAAVLSAVASGDSIINGCEAVNKSYPNFFEDYNLLGGKANGGI